MRRCDVLAPSVRDRIDAGLIAGAGDRLRLIANFGAGTDNIDLAAAKARGIAVTNTPDVLTEDTADLVMALILVGPRRLGEGERNLRAGRWRGWGPTDQLGRSLTGKALGIIGMGRIGGAVARRARAFGMTVHYHNRRPVPGEEARYWARPRRHAARDGRGQPQRPLRPSDPPSDRPAAAGADPAGRLADQRRPRRDWSTRRR
jgi:lactate dehydrogenase-like 2-hydroxyacid dehydrogenase